MDEKTLLIFAKRIFSTSSEQKAKASLGQLRELLMTQGAPKSQIALLDTMLQSTKEMTELARKPVLSRVDVEIADRRAKDRRAREEMARMHSRC